MILAQLGSEGGSPLSFWLMMGALFLVMYALIIHPQRKQQKEHQKMLGEVARGDQVVTNGGIHGRVTGITDDVLTIEIAQNVKVKVNKTAIASRQTGDAKAEAAKS
jgi:preprotein translocase subunit YajC